MSKKKECQNCKHIIAVLNQDFRIDCDQRLLPELLLEKIEEDQDLQKTHSALRQTYVNHDAHLTKENALLRFELEQVNHELNACHEELTRTKAALEQLGIDCSEHATDNR